MTGNGPKAGTQVDRDKNRRLEERREVTGDPSLERRRRRRDRNRSLDVHRLREDKDRRLLALRQR